MPLFYARLVISSYSQPSESPSVSLQPSVCSGEVNLCIALDHSGSICSHSLLNLEVDGPDMNGASACLNCPNICQDSCRNGSYGIFNPCPFPDKTGYDKNTCCWLFDRFRDVAREIITELGKDGRPAEFSVVGFQTSAFHQYADGKISKKMNSYAGPMMNASDAEAAMNNSDFRGGYTNHERGIRWW